MNFTRNSPIPGSQVLSGQSPAYRKTTSKQYEVLDLCSTLDLSGSLGAMRSIDVKSSSSGIVRTPVWIARRIDMSCVGVATDDCRRRQFFTAT